MVKTREEKLEVKRAWCRANPEKVKAVAKKSREKHKEQRKLDNKAWVEKNYEKHLEYHRIYNKSWYKKNKEIHDARRREWDKDPENKKKRVKYVQKYRDNNKETIIPIP